MSFIKLNFNVDVNKSLRGLKTMLRLGRPKSGIKILEKEMKKLGAKREDIENKINEAEREGKIPTNEVNQWLKKVVELEGQVAVINQDFQTMSCFSCNCFNQTGGTSSQTQQAEDQVRESSNCCSIIRRVAKKLSEANELLSQAGALNQIATVEPPEPTVMFSISHRPPIGIESYVEEIVGYIDGGEDNIIGIYGMGGVGKTTVLNRIQQHYLLEQKIFDCVIWVVASKDCQLKKLQMDITKKLGLQTMQENDDEQTCGDNIFRYLKKRNCLLLLDDIWEHVNLQLFGMAHSATEQGQQQQQSTIEQGQQQQRKVVVFTTRKKRVCAQMEAQKKIKVKCLDPNQAWKLFKKNSDRNVLNSNAGIKFIAKELAKECAGLPLALITVARAMLGQDSQYVWNYALHQIKEEHEWTTIDSSEDSTVMYNAFKVSYDSLRNDSLKECLLCCVLWPEDYDIHIFEELIPCWIGCGIIHKFDTINEAFNEGCFHLQALMDASLLEYSSRRQDYYEAQHVKMHDVIRDMTLLMLKENGRKWIIKVGIGLSHLPRQEEWQETERASFMDNEITSLQDYGTSIFPKLSMLNLHSNHLSVIPPTLFTNMPLLTYLNLSLNLGIEELLKEIGSLTELQYLNLSETSITRLPIEFGCLSKLEYLLLRDTKLEIVPYGTISNLSMLKWLDIREIYPESEWWWDELEHFKGCHYLSLGITINPANLERLKMFPYNIAVWNLTVRGLGSSKFSEYNLSTLQWQCEMSIYLGSLEISDVPGDNLMMLSDWRTLGWRAPDFSKLKTLSFRRLEQLENIWFTQVEPEFEFRFRFHNLRDIYICGCNKLKDVSWALQLPHLSLLDIKNCEGIEELISNVGNSNLSFNIKMLSLNGMRNLHSISHQPLRFPCLQYIRVLYCPQLKKLPFEINMLKEIEGEKEWWNDLDWDEERHKDSLTPYFREVFY